MEKLQLQSKAQELVSMANELGVEAVIIDQPASLAVDFMRNYLRRDGEVMKTSGIRSYISFTATGKIRVESWESGIHGKKIAYKDLRDWVAFIPEQDASRDRLIRSLQSL